MFNRGQVLLLITLLLGALIISASLFVGFLSVQKLKQSNNVVDSQQAFYASDTGIDEELYRILKANGTGICPFSNSNSNIGFRVISCANGATGDDYFQLIIKSSGQAYKAVRNQIDSSYSISSSTVNAENLPLCSENLTAINCPSNLAQIY